MVLLCEQPDPPPTASNYLNIIAVAGVLIIAGIILVVSFANFQPGTQSEYVKIAGTIASSNNTDLRVQMRNMGWHDIRLNERPEVFRIDMHHIKRIGASERAQLTAGTAVEITALQSNAAAPKSSLISDSPIIFVKGLNANGQDIFTYRDDITHDRVENVYKLIFAVVLLIAGILALLGIIGLKQKGRDDEKHRKRLKKLQSYYR